MKILIRGQEIPWADVVAQYYYKQGLLFEDNPYPKDSTQHFEYQEEMRKLVNIEHKLSRESL